MTTPVKFKSCNICHGKLGDVVYQVKIYSSKTKVTFCSAECFRHYHEKVWVKALEGRKLVIQGQENGNKEDPK